VTDPTEDRLEGLIRRLLAGEDVRSDRAGSASSDDEEQRADAELLEAAERALGERGGVVPAEVDSLILGRAQRIAKARSSSAGMREALLEELSLGEEARLQPYLEDLGLLQSVPREVDARISSATREAMRPTSDRMPGSAPNVRSIEEERRRSRIARWTLAAPVFAAAAVFLVAVTPPPAGLKPTLPTDPESRPAIAMIVGLAHARSTRGDVDGAAGLLRAAVASLGRSGAKGPDAGRFTTAAEHEAEELEAKPTEWFARWDARTREWREDGFEGNERLTISAFEKLAEVATPADREALSDAHRIAREAVSRSSRSRVDLGWAAYLARIGAVGPAREVLQPILDSEVEATANVRRAARRVIERLDATDESE